MKNFEKHLINTNSKIKDALYKLNRLGSDAILFVVDSKTRLIGSLTDGDVRRGLLKNFDINDKIDDIIQPDPKYITVGENNLNKIINFRKEDFRIIPVISDKNIILDVINFRLVKSYLPLDAVIMAGGYGKRLLPLTEKIPKPMLKIGDKPIIEHNLDRLIKFGIKNYWISIKYHGNRIEEYFKDGIQKNVKINYVKEDLPLGTIGALSLIKNFKHDYILVTNSDLLTKLNYENFFVEFISKDADMAVLTIPYEVKIPYGIVENKNQYVTDIIEKPTYTYYSNGGIYLIKKKLLKNIPKNTFFDSPDLIKKLMKLNYKVISIPFSGYWLDIGNHEDFNKAQIDIKNLNL